MNIFSKVGFSLSVAAIGLLIVFTGLAILIGCITILSKLMGGMNERKAAREKANAPAPAPQPAPAPVVEEPATDDGELIAVISAALAAYSKANGGKPLVVKNIRRANAWAAAGRADQIARF